MEAPINFQNMILNNEDELIKLNFKLEVFQLKSYNFIIHNIWKDSLNIVVFIRYDTIFHHTNSFRHDRQYPIESQLRKLISPNAESLFDLKMDTKIKKPKLFKETILFEIQNEKYTFKISGAGSDAIKLSRKITFTDIYLAKKPLEKILKNIIFYIYADRKRTWDMSPFELKQILS